MYNSYLNKFLEIDLTSGSVNTGNLEEGVLEEYIGGKGLGLKILVSEFPYGDAFAPENPLIFLTGPLTGTLVQTSARSVLVTKSPLTNGFLDTHAGGHLGPKLKRAGYDYIIIKGKSPKPVYLIITPEECQIKNASGFWGKGILETERELKKKYPGSKVASIGPAGEKQVLYACIGTELYRQFGRGGAGAVMGSKNLKAVVIDGDEKINYYDEKEFKKLNKQLSIDIKNHPNAKKRYDVGTMMWVRMGQEIGKFLPTRNFQKGLFDDYEKITAETMKKELNWKSVGCYNCVIKCAKLARWNGNEIEGPEYETTAYLGSGCEISDPKIIARANLLCDDLGLDTISTGVTASFAMECYEKGLLEKTDNLKLTFGNGEALLKLIEKIGNRDGIGDLFAQGTKRASEVIGQGSDYFAIQSAGMEISGVNIKGAMSMGLVMATSDFASHTRCWSATDEMNGNLTLEEVPEYVMNAQDEINARNSLIVCDFLPFGFDRLAQVLNKATGFNFTEESIMKSGERIFNLARLYNIKNGRTKKDDTIPGRFLNEKMIAGILEGKVMSKEFFNDLVQKYYKIRGWDDNGIPLKEKLKELNVADMK